MSKEYDIDPGLQDMKSILELYSDWSDLIAINDAIDVIDLILKSSKDELLEIDSSLRGNMPGYNDYHKDQFTLKIINKYCQDIYLK